MRLYTGQVIAASASLCDQLRSAKTFDVQANNLVITFEGKATSVTTAIYGNDRAGGGNTTSIYYYARLDGQTDTTIESDQIIAIDR